jgi:hypothetical protein
MSGVPARRLAALSGLALTAAVALWWLGSTRLAMAQGADAARPSADALQALWLVRALVLALLGPRVGALLGWRLGLLATLGLVAPAWPLVVLVWSASSVPLAPLALSEIALAAAAVLLPGLGPALRRALRQPAMAELAGTTVGVTLAVALWMTQGYFWASLLR